MPELIYYVAASLDGYIATPDGDYEKGIVIRLDYDVAWRFTTFDGNSIVYYSTGEIVDFIQGLISV